jgi:hypothetical protein
MKPSVLKQLLLYRYRYQTGILIFIVLLVGLLLLRIDLAPAGLSQDEMNSAVASATLKFEFPFTQSLIDLPYKLLQKASLSYIGLNEWGIVTPSLLLGLATGVAFLMMVRRWFRMNVALITSFILVTSAGFLVLARGGTPMIMTTFWLSIILLAVTNILHPEGKSKLWGFVLLLALPLSLYTPLMIYPLIAIAIAGILHPHIRFVARRMSTWEYVVGALAMVLLLAPLIVWLVGNPSGIRELVGIPPVLPGIADIWFNIKVILKSLLNVGSAVVGTIPQPIFGAASLIIITLGFFKTIADRHSARSYMLLIWAGLFIPVVIFNPQHILIALVPAYLFMAIGVETLIREWYKLFPLNPYARLAGLVPLVILLGGIMISNSAQYFYGYFYGTPNVVYKQQLESTNKIIDDAPPDKDVHVVVVTNEQPFYDLLRRDHDNVTIHTSLHAKPGGRAVIHDGASFAPVELGAPKRIVTSYTATQNQVILRYFE